MDSKNVMEQYRVLLEKAETVVLERDESRRIRIQVGSATCEKAAGADDVLKEFRKLLQASGAKEIVLRKTGCTGRCSREPIVTVSFPGRPPVKYERVDRDLVHDIFVGHVQGGRPVHAHILDADGQSPSIQFRFMYCRGDRCGREKMPEFEADLRAGLKKAGVGEDRYEIIKSNCLGLCADPKDPAVHMMMQPSKAVYRLESLDDLDRVIREHVAGGKTVDGLLVKSRPRGRRFFEIYGDVPFFNRQSRIALRNSGLIDPDDMHDYIMSDGFLALAQVLDRNDRDWVIRQVSESRLRGRGGGGYPTGLKWRNADSSTDPERYIICNADEGDPGAFMDRSMLEGDPFGVIEGMMIGGFAIGARRGFFYIRAEYPLAISRVENAIKKCREAGLLGSSILGSGFDFELEVRLGAGAFVCGEETALIHSIEGLRGQPRVRPPYPTEEGLWGKPTVINNVETFANVPAVFLYDPAWFAALGTEKSGGTKVFALAGKVRHTGLVEVPIGTSLREIVFDIGGGIPGERKLKAVQTGGPAGGCIPADRLDTVVDFDSLLALGSMMGSGGMIVMDEDDCMVDIARFFLAFSHDESCGKCTPCREGTKRMLEIIGRITAGDGTMEDIDKLERLGMLLRRSSLCGLGRAAPNPVLSTLQYFRHEYEAHVRDKLCPANRCKALSPETVRQ
ncbi:MAG TPA: NuoF family protein [Acidobacteriota bacterium]|nr:NuoF family protein [Acidobacteriota bacterium]